MGIIGFGQNVLSSEYGKYALALLVIVITICVERIFRFILHRYIERSTILLKADKTQFVLMKHVLSAAIYLIGIAIAVLMIPKLKTLSVSMFAGAGVLAIVIGFASQKTVSNLISGVFIAMFKPFRVGDMIKFNETIGIVEDITLRHTVIKNFENKRVVVPNSIISDTAIENYNIEDERICRYIEIGISYDSDINKAIKIMQEEAMKHPEFMDIRSAQEKEENKPAVPVRVIGFGDSSVNLKAWVWAKDPGAAFRIGCDLNKSIKERFDKEGIEIPFPYRTIVYKKNLPKPKKMRKTVKKTKKATKKRTPRKKRR
ncbi:mechanosensitive ion channel family protein [Candidatus Woesearchaeota archaeon]|nr:mechanosensitive ion channel family protein [Candidatus Woesearchaeota archaeon]